MTESSLCAELTPRQVRAARALLAWSQRDLAKAARVGISTVADFERGSRRPVANNAQAIRTALEGAGITFLPAGAVIGPAVPPIAVAGVSGIPVRWVSAQDLSDWAGRTDGPLSLPELLSKLVRAAHDRIKLRFPSDEGVRHAGWDGVTDAVAGSDYIPEGRAGWELSAQRSNIPQKATEDYKKRTAAPGPLDPAESTYIFVTLHHWPRKDAWAEARRAEGTWREVRVYDADDLVHWIEQHPAVGLWIARRLNKRPPGTRELDEVWEEWSRATEWPLTEDLVLADRSEDSAEILRWLRREPAVLSLQATTTDEVAAFFHATLSELPDDLAAHYRARTLVVTAEGARALKHAPPPLILVLTEPDPGLAGALTKRGHFVLQAYDERRVGRGELRALARPSREGIAAGLCAAGIAEPRAKSLARDSARNLAVLRRLIPGAPGRLPAWAEGTPPKALLGALLAGGWIETSEGDRACLAELADQPYDAIIADLAPLVGDFDQPLQKVGPAWRIRSPWDAWMLLARFLTPAHLDRFENVAQAVLGAPDPRFDMEPDDRGLADIRGIRPTYSSLLRHGVGQVLILLALWGGEIRTVADARRRADAIVARLLQDADSRRWWSLSRDFRLLAEASPDAFLTALEESLDRNDPPIRVLFHEDGGIFETEYLSDLMWALESLAWSPDWMPRVTHVLARLNVIDVKPRKHANGPMRSLREIHLLWSPQSYATQEERMRAIDLIRKREPRTAWELMLRVLPSRSGYWVSNPSCMPRWRDFSVDEPEVVTLNLVSRGAVAISERLVADVGLDPARWAALLDRLGDLALGPEPAVAALEAAEPKITDAAHRAIFWEKLRCVLHHHRQLRGADWSLPEEALARLDAVYERLTPTDPLARAAWLFGDSVALPKPTGEGWEAERREIDAARQAAAQALYKAGGIPAILGLARLVENPDFIGKALYKSGFPVADLDALIEAAARSADNRERGIAHGLIVSSFRDRKEAWAEGLIARAWRQAWGDDALLTILQALPIGRWTWDQVAKIGGETLATYWRRVPVFPMDEDSGEIAYAIRQLLDVGRARAALTLLGSRPKKGRLPTAILLEVLEQAARQPIKNTLHGNEFVMFQHGVAAALSELDSRGDVDRNALARLEWKYLSVLEYSRRPPKVLLSVLSEQPGLFIEMLSAVFRASEESGIAEPEPADPEQARAVAYQAYRLLNLWDQIPGRRGDNTIDGEVLEAWIKEARALAKAVGREEMADRQIGQMLSASPMGADGAWPAEPVREALDLFRSKFMLEGFRMGKLNRRGVTSRAPGDGGDPERCEAAKYRGWAKTIDSIDFEHPRTAKALKDLAEDYDRQARRLDEVTERRDWEA